MEDSSLHVLLKSSSSPGLQPRAVDAPSMSSLAPLEESMFSAKRDASKSLHFDDKVTINNLSKIPTTDFG